MILTDCDHPTCGHFTQISALGGASEADSGTGASPTGEDLEIVVHVSPENGKPRIWTQIAPHVP